MKLKSRPDGNVVIDVLSLDETEGIVSSPSSLTFTAENHNAVQTVTVTGIDDPAVDGDPAYQVQLRVNTGATTDSTDYKQLLPYQVSVINTDDDTAGFDNGQSGNGHMAYRLTPVQVMP